MPNDGFGVGMQVMRICIDCSLLQKVIEATFTKTRLITI